ncbi:hypothetical protein T265_06586 [Opisthorchis viverrini]|uniref:Uncharacterized protein n=1 Tax=Opisthorchis viverrini TaxID=6198 RepID=A0A074ZFQ0_OPIVI|nr:hypothetical protein T265_06586 [Opisthorchis viverrini]KER26106.1 hypothetical protein T265_06586 [Opisthorchis viverrini]
MPVTWISEDTSETIRTENAEKQEPMQNSSETAAQKSQSSIATDKQPADQSLPSGQNPSNIPTETQDHNSQMTNRFTHSRFNEEENAQTEESLDSSSGDMQHKSESPDTKEANTIASTIANAQQPISNPTEPAAHMPATRSGEDTRETNQTGNAETREPLESSSSTAAQKSQSLILTDTQTADPALRSAKNPSGIPTETPNRSSPIKISISYRPNNEAEVLQTEEILDSSTGNIHHASILLSIANIYLVSSLIACLN